MKNLEANEGPRSRSITNSSRNLLSSVLFIFCLISFTVQSPFVEAEYNLNEIKKQLAPLDELITSLNVCNKCNMPKIEELDRANVVMQKFETNLKDPTVWDKWEMQMYDNLRNNILANWSSTRQKMDLSLVIPARASRVMMQLVEKYHVQRCGYSSCSDLIQVPHVKDLKAGIGANKIMNVNSALTSLPQATFVHG